MDTAMTEVRELAAEFREQQVRNSVYTREEIEAMTSPQAECSWAPKGILHGPSTYIAWSSGDRVIAGVEIWQQMRDRFYYLDMLVRDQAPAYKGVGVVVARKAIGLLMRQTEETPFGVRLHAMKKEERLVDWWSDEVLYMQPNIDDAFVRTADHYFPAVGWLLRATPQQ